MNKIILKIFLLITFVVVMLGFVGPFLLSAPSDIAVALGYILSFATGWLTFTFGNNIYKNIKVLKESKSKKE